MRKLMLTATAVAALLIASAAPALGAHGSKGCSVATGWAHSAAQAKVATACSLGR